MALILDQVSLAKCPLWVILRSQRSSSTPETPP
jgi:hypothetical protein